MMGEEDDSDMEKDMDRKLMLLANNSLTLTIGESAFSSPVVRVSSWWLLPGCTSTCRICSSGQLG